MRVRRLRAFNKQEQKLMLAAVLTAIHERVSACAASWRVLPRACLRVL